MSILDNRPALAKAVGQVAEVAGYLWQKGWAERNGGNITVEAGTYDVELYLERSGNDAKMYAVLTKK